MLNKDGSGDLINRVKPYDIFMSMSAINSNLSGSSLDTLAKRNRLPRVTQETEPEEFLKLLPFSLENAEAILENLKVEKLYNGKFWSGLRVTDETRPGKRKREPELYQPFVEITQSIAKNTEKYQCQRHLRGTWVNTHIKSATASNPDSDLVLAPDVCFAYENPLPANPGDHGESQGNNVSAVCVFILSSDFNPTEHDTSCKILAIGCRYLLWSRSR